MVPDERLKKALTEVEQQVQRLSVGRERGAVREAELLAALLDVAELARTGDSAGVVAKVGATVRWLAQEGEPPRCWRRGRLVYLTDDAAARLRGSSEQDYGNVVISLPANRPHVVELVEVEATLAAIRGEGPVP